MAAVMNARRWLVAYSGGVDSHVLLHLLLQLPDHPPIEAVHVNHQLQYQADQWVLHCQLQADRLGVPLHVETVTVHCGARESLEDKARQARYRVFEAMLQTGDILLLGHHLDDQVETLLLRLLRGSGSRGAGAMPRSRSIAYGHLLRPLLETARADLEHYAQVNQLDWVEDPSNQSTDYDRNYLRREVLPTLSGRWPEYRQTLSRTAALLEESAQLNAELAEQDLHTLGLYASQPSLPLAALAELSVARQKNIIRHWLLARQLPLPSSVQLQVVLDEVINARQDAEPLVAWPGVQVRRFKRELYAMKPLPGFNNAEVYPWDLSSSLQLGGIGVLSASTLPGSGLDYSRLDRQSISVCFRQGGERCQPAGRSGSQSLKKLFQEYQVAPWLRDRWPLIYCGDILIAVAGLWICEGFQVANEQEGLSIDWQWL